MCGIAGIFGPLPHGHATHAGLVARMLAALEHRGDPDAGGEMAEGPGFGLGTNRLAITDPEHGRQPFTDDAGRFAVLNGQIYNQADLRAELGPQGFATYCDTETLLPAWRRWGDGFASRLRGMFALACYDPATGAYLLARDPLGIKPLYYAHLDEALIFASELKAFGVLPEIPHLRVLAPGTQLGPGGLRRYAPRPTVTRRAITPDSVRASLETAVSLRLPPPGQTAAILLSGGIDSSIVLLLAQQLHDGPVRAFTIHNPEAQSGDLEAARQVCAHISVPLTEVSAATEDLQAFYLDRGVLLVETFEPALVRNAVLYHFLARAVRAAGFKYCLSGEGADEVFGGYDYLWQHPPQNRDAVIETSLREIHRTYLQMADRAAMGARLEVRVPYMDDRFVTDATGLPPELRLSPGTNKVFLRTAFAAELPAAITQRSKIGMNGGAGFGSNDPGESIYDLAVAEHYRRDEQGFARDYAIARAHGGAFCVNLDIVEEIYNFTRFYSLGFARSVDEYARPQVNTSALVFSGEPKKGVTNE